MPRSRIFWYSRSVSVIAGATVTESPVCTPIGSTFSIEQTDDDVVAAVAHQLEFVFLPAVGWTPRSARSRPGRGGQARRRPIRSIVSACAIPDPSPPMVNGADHHGAGPVRRPSAHLVHGVAHTRLRADSTADLDRLTMSFEPLPVLAALDGSKSAPISRRRTSPAPRSRAGRRRCSARSARPGWPAPASIGAALGLLRDDLLDERRGDRLDVGGVGELRVGRDRRRVGVDQADPEPLGRSTRQAWVPE